MLFLIEDLYHSRMKEILLFHQKISTEAQELLGIGSGLKINTVMDEHKVYLDYHRNHILQ